MVNIEDIVLFVLEESDYNDRKEWCANFSQLNFCSEYLWGTRDWVSCELC